jgi:hypothetical protein
MPIQAVLDEAGVTALDDSLKPLYVKNEKDNLFWLDMSGEDAAKLAKPLQDEVLRLKTHGDTVLGEKKTIAEELKAFKALGKKPEEIQEFLKANANIDLNAINIAHQTELAKVQDSVKEIVEASTKERAEAVNQLHTYMKKSYLAELKNKYELSDAADDVLGNRLVLMPEAEGSTKMAFRVIENGELSYKAGSFKTPEQLIEELRENKGLQGIFYAGSATGTPPARQSGMPVGTKTATRAEWATWSPQQSTTFFEAGGQIKD